MTAAELIKQLKKYPDDTEIYAGELGRFPPTLQSLTAIEYTSPETGCKPMVELYSGVKDTELHPDYSPTTPRHILPVLIGNVFGVPNKDIQLDTPLRAVFIRHGAGYLVDIGGLTLLDDGTLALEVGTAADLRGVEGGDYLIFKQYSEGGKDLPSVADIEDAFSAIPQVPADCEGFGVDRCNSCSHFSDCVERELEQGVSPLDEMFDKLPGIVIE